VKQNAVHGASTAEQASKVINEVFGDVKVKSSGEVDAGELINPDLANIIFITHYPYNNVYLVSDLLPPRSNFGECCRHRQKRAASGELPAVRRYAASP